MSGDLLSIGAQLYHCTSSNATLKILQSNKLLGNDTYGEGRKYICFTIDDKYVVDDLANIRIEVNSSLLALKYRIEHYVDPEFPELDESEYRIYTNEISNLKPFIVEIEAIKPLNLNNQNDLNLIKFFKEHKGEYSIGSNINKAIKNLEKVRGDIMGNPIMTKAKLNTVMKNIVKIINNNGPNEEAILDEIFAKYPGAEVTDGEVIIDGKELVNVAFNLPFSYKPTIKELEKFSDFDGAVKNLENIKVEFLTVIVGINDKGKVILESSFWVEAFDEWNEESVNFSLDLGMNDEFVIDIKGGANNLESILKENNFMKVDTKVDRVIYEKVIGDVKCHISVFTDDLIRVNFYTKNGVEFRPSIQRYSKSESDLQALLDECNKYKNLPLEVKLEYFTAQLIYNGLEASYRAKLLIDKVNNIDAVSDYLESVASFIERRQSVFFHFNTLDELKQANDNIPNVDVVNQVNTEVTPDDQIGDDVLDNIQVTDLVGLEELRNMFTQNGYTIVIANQENIRGFYGDANLNIGFSVTFDNGDDTGETVDVYVNVSGVGKRKDQLIKYLQDKGFDEEGWVEFNDIKFNLRELNNQLKLYKGVVDQFNKKADEFDQLKKEERKANKEARKNEPKLEVIHQEGKFRYVKTSKGDYVIQSLNSNGRYVAHEEKGMTFKGSHIDTYKRDYATLVLYGRLVTISPITSEEKRIEYKTAIDAKLQEIFADKKEKTRELSPEEQAYLGASIEQLKSELRDLGVANPKGVKLALIRQLIELKKGTNPGEMNTIDLIKVGLTKQGFKIDANGNQFRAELNVGQVKVIVSTHKQGIYAIVEGPKGVDVENNTIELIQNSGFIVVHNNKDEGARLELDFNGAGKRDADNYIDKIIKCAENINDYVSKNNSEVIDNGGVNMVTHDITIDRDELEGDLIIRSKALGVTKHVNDEDLLQEMDKLDKLAAKKNIQLNWIDLRKDNKNVDGVVSNLVREYRDKIANRPNVKTNTLIDKDTNFLPGFSVKVDGFKQFDVLIEEQNKKFKATIQPEGDFKALHAKVSKLIQELQQKGFDAKEDGLGVAVYGKYNANDLSIVHDLSKLIDTLPTVNLDVPTESAPKKNDIDLDNLNNLKVNELKQILNDLGITSPRGVKASLIQQIKDIKGDGTKGAEKTPEPAPKPQDEKPQVQPKAVEDEPAPKAEVRGKNVGHLDDDQKAQLGRLQDIAKKLANDVNADDDLTLRFLEEPSEFKKYKLPTVALALVCYDMNLGNDELKQDPVFKRFKSIRGTSLVGKWFKTEDANGRPCRMVLFVDREFEKASPENGKEIRKLDKRVKMMESVGTEIEYSGGTFLLESIGNNYARFIKDGKTYLVNIDDLDC